MSDARTAIIPLPAGGNFNGIRWDQAGGPLASRDVEAVLEYNAMCQWLRALHDGRQPADARGVLATVARWPAMDAVSVAPLADQQASRQLLRACVASHRREVAYAHAIHLRAST